MFIEPSKQPLPTNMIEHRIRQAVEPVARADADALKAVILAELVKFGMDAFHVNLTGFIDEVRSLRLNALIRARTAEVAKCMVDARGSGQTAQQMQAASFEAVFVWCNNSLHYPRDLARHLGRTDLRIVSPSWVGSGQAQGCAHTIIVDHAAALSLRQRDEVDVINNHVQRWSSNG